MPVNKSQRFSIRLLIEKEWINSLNEISQAHMTSRLGIIRKYIKEGMIADLEQMKEDFERLKRIEATKKELSQRLKAHKGMKTSSIKEILDY